MHVPKICAEDFGLVLGNAPTSITRDKVFTLRITSDKFLPFAIESTGTHEDIFPVVKSFPFTDRGKNTYS